MIHTSLKDGARRILGAEGEPRVISLSDLQGASVKAVGRQLKFDGPCAFTIASPFDLAPLVAALKQGFTLGGAKFTVDRVETLSSPEYCGMWVAQPSSPILTKKEGRWFTPEDDCDACNAALRLNLAGKWERLSKDPETAQLLRQWSGTEGDLLEWGNANLPDFEILPGTCSHNRPLKQGSVKAWSGSFQVHGHSAWNELLWHAGLGAKTIFGFGLVLPYQIQK
jgi:CRISPR/Cas system endoribonuclease Cas6 (RAMP superfamily)